MNDKWSRIAGDENVYSGTPARIVCIKPSKYLPFDTQAKNNAQWEKDARLIAAAPELLAALDYALAVADEGLRLGAEWREKTRAVIAKAKGERA